MLRSHLQLSNILGAAGILVAAVLGLARSANAEAAQARRPNILFVYADDHAAHAISAYGSRINRTPHIDRLAAEGMLFRDHFVANSICTPARATVLTGKFSHANGTLNVGDRFESSQVTFPKLLQQAGYETAVIGKWHLSSDPVGFDYWNILIGQGPYYNPPMIDNGQRRRYTGYTTDVITDLTLEWLKQERNADKPFMLMYQHKAPHRNWEPGPDHLNTFDDETIPDPETLFDDYATRTSAARLQEMTIANHMSRRDLMLQPPTNYTEEQLRDWHAAFDDENEAHFAADPKGREKTKWNYQRYIKDYLRCVQSIDDNLGRVLAYLDESGLADNTIVIYSSDQGFFLGEHGWYDKRFMYEESLRSPLVVRWPGTVEPGSVDEHMTQNVDFAQTFLDMAGVDAPEATNAMQGESLVPLLKGEEPEEWRDAIYYHYYDFPAVHQVHRHYGVRDGRYKLIHFYDLDEWELFDLEQDAHEINNVYGDPAYAEVVERMKARLATLQQQYGDTDPTQPNAEVYNNFYRSRIKGMETRLELEFLKPTVPSQPREQFDPAMKPLTVGTICLATEGDGVLISQGGRFAGYSLYLKGGLPRFAVRNGGELRTVVGPDPLPADRPVLVAGMLDAEGNLSLHVDGETVATAAGLFISSVPNDPLLIGADRASAVGDRQNPAPFAGPLWHVRLYTGLPDEQALAEWAAKERQ